MQQTIYKYPIPLDTLPSAYNEVRIEIPKGYSILKVGMQNNKAYLWALIEPDNKLVDLDLLIVGTGHPISTDTLQYIDILQIATDGSDNPWYVGHVFEVL